MTINVFEALWLLPSLIALILAIRNLREARADWHAAGCNGEANKVIAKSNLITQSLRFVALTISTLAALFVSGRLETEHIPGLSEWAVIITVLTFTVMTALLSYNDSVTRDKLNAVEVQSGEH